MPEAEFLAAAERLRKADVPVLSANWFLPPTLKVVGPEADDKSRVHFWSWLWAAHLGAKAVVFGSPGIIPFFEHLAGIGYGGGVSVEATVGADLAKNCAAAVGFFENYFSSCG